MDKLHNIRALAIRLELGGIVIIYFKEPTKIALVIILVPYILKMMKAGTLSL